MEPTPTANLGPHETAIEIGIAVNRSVYDTLYVAFAIAMGADKLAVADGVFIRRMRKHPDSFLAGLRLSLHDWAASRGIAGG